jgi:protein TonB
MAFESYRTQGQGGARKSRRVTYTLSALVHGALIVLGVVYSFWHVDELTPPTLRVTFMSGAPPPPPPPPPPPAGGSAKKKATVKPKVVALVTPKPTDIVQPREAPTPVKKEVRRHDDEEDDEDEPAGVKGGVKGGIAGGSIGGVIGGTLGGTHGGVVGGAIGGTGPASSAAPKFLAPNLGALQKASGVDPVFPPSLRKGDLIYVVIAKICVSRTGSVDSVGLMKKADALLDQNVISAVKGWRYHPLTANDITVPFCYPARFEFKSQ